MREEWEVARSLYHLIMTSRGSFLNNVLSSRKIVLKIILMSGKDHL